jgi:HSP20 family molecular chaperone IbpA
MPINAGQVNRNIRRVDTDLITHFQNHSTSAALDDADATKIMAEFHDGVLTVHLPKSPTAKPKPIETKG